MIQPLELRTTRPMTLHGGVSSTTTQVWEMLAAARTGDGARMLELMSERPELATCEFNYTPPLHFAVREGHTAVVRELVSRQAFDPSYKSYPFGDSLLTMADDRGHVDSSRILQDALATPGQTRKWRETGEIDYGQDEEQKRFDKAVHADLLDTGMSPRHRTWHGVTLLHDMAQSGDVRKARLLLDRGADIDAVDGEYRSTPIGMAARWGQRDMVRLLLDRGADANKAGAAWSTPLAWARRKGHTALAQDLVSSGARGTSP